MAKTFRVGKAWPTKMQRARRELEGDAATTQAQVSADELMRAALVGCPRRSDLRWKGPEFVY